MQLTYSEPRVSFVAVRSRVRRALVIVSASLAVAVTAHLVVPVPFSPVPLTLQPLAVLAIGLLLGPIDGTLALLAYLAEGLAGLPVFSPTGPGGVAQLLGPTGGYLMADPVVALTAGLIAQRCRPLGRPFAAAVLASTLAVCVLYASGAGWLGHLIHQGPVTLLHLAVLPYLPGEVVKVFIAASMYKTFSRRLHP